MEDIQTTSVYIGVEEGRLKLLMDVNMQGLY